MIWKISPLVADIISSVLIPVCAEGHFKMTIDILNKSAQIVFFINNFNTDLIFFRNSQEIFLKNTHCNEPHIKYYLIKISILYCDFHNNLFKLYLYLCIRIDDCTGHHSKWPIQKHKISNLKHPWFTYF